MSYDYESHRGWLGTVEGGKAIGEVLANIERVLKPAGCAMMCKLWPATGDSWSMMAAVDRCVEMGVLREIPYPEGRTPMAQYRIFTSAEAR
jgi:hypothetical protein